jgi:hypothetical protein
MDGGGGGPSVWAVPPRTVTTMTARPAARRLNLAVLGMLCNIIDMS